MFGGMLALEGGVAGSAMSVLLLLGKAAGSAKAMRGTGEGDTWTAVWVGVIVLLVLVCVIWRVRVESRE